MTYIRQQAYTYEDDERIEAPAPTHYRATRPPQNDQIIQARSTRPGRALAPAPQHQQRPRRDWHFRFPTFHPFVYIGLGMFALFTLWFVGVRVYAWSVNTLHNPAYYTQTAHRDTANVTIDAQHTDQVRAFIDSQGHIDLLIIPDSNISKARLVQGPMVQNVSDPQQAYISVTAQGTSITVTAQGSLEVQGLVIPPNSMEWQTDMGSKRGGK